MPALLHDGPARRWLLVVCAAYGARSSACVPREALHVRQRCRPRMRDWRAFGLVPEGQRAVSIVDAFNLGVAAMFVFAVWRNSREARRS